MLSVGWTPLSHLLTVTPSDSFRAELNQAFWRTLQWDPVLRYPFAEDGLLQGLFIGGCREKWPKKTGTVYIGGKMNGGVINILQLKMMKFFPGKLWRSFAVSRHSWVNLSIATCFPGWLTSGIFSTLPVVLKCLFFPYWGATEICVCPLVLLVWFEGQKIQGKPSYQNPSGTVKEQQAPMQVGDCLVTAKNVQNNSEKHLSVILALSLILYPSHQAFSASSSSSSMVPALLSWLLVVVRDR